MSNEVSVVLNETKQSISSLEIAEMTGKRHDNVTRDIKKQLDALEINALSFEVVYKDSKGEERPMYVLDKEQSLILASGYNVQLRQKIIKRWIELETTVSVPKALTLEEMTLQVISGLTAKVTDTQKQLESVKHSKRSTKAWVTKKNNIISSIKETLGCNRESKLAQDVKVMAEELTTLKTPYMTSTELANTISEQTGNVITASTINKHLINMRLAQRDKKTGVLHLTMIGRGFGQTREYNDNGKWCYYPAWKSSVLDLIIEHISKNN